MEIPVYLFTGFLESGKTTFIQDALEGDDFNAGERTLLLLCEEGEVELEPEKFFPYAQIDVVQFPDDLGGDQIIEKTFKGPLHQQLREALQYIRNVVLTERV